MVAVCSLPTLWQFESKHVIFGRILDGMDLLTVMQLEGSGEGDTKRKVTMVDCGEVRTSRPRPAPSPVSPPLCPRPRSRPRSGLGVIARTRMECVHASCKGAQASSCARAGPLPAVRACVLLARVHPCRMSRARTLFLAVG